ncbi:MAG: UDP-3-O-(3-hydroxymyristoyl)glucosamine N-acyltransferase, partial [Rickettsiales bacterium]|nr:UDP-3-O-(3-hydroxymyristoyl)glucosamine N-acyltransferase [Rickettsiales bacterium]
DNLEKVAEYKRNLSASKAGACFITKEDAALLPPGVVPAITDDPELAFVKLEEYFSRDRALEKRGISDRADIDPSAKIGKGVHVGPFAVIEADVVIGDGCYIGAGAKIKVGCGLGPGCIVRENAVVGHAVLGAGVVIAEGAVIGNDGFGWHSSAAGHRWVPQIGRVILGDGVFVGANSTIARGSQGDTVVGRGTKMDSLCLVSHNDRLGENCIMAGMSGIAGSTVLGDWVLVGAQAGISGHLKIGDGVHIGAGGGVIQDLAPGAKVSGYPAQPIPDFLRQAAMLRTMVRKKKPQC